MTALIVYVVCCLLIIIAGILIWIFVPTFQCPVCHTYKVKELETELGKMLHCENEDCKHDWRSM